MTVSLARSGHSSESAAGRKAAFRSGKALPPATKGGAPGFPITDASHWEKARQAVGRVKDPARRTKLAKLLRKTAPQFGKQKALQQSWAAPGGGQMHANPYLRGIELADSDDHDFDDTIPGKNMAKCPNCGYVADNAQFAISGGSAGTSDQAAPGALRTPDATPDTRSGAPLTVRGASSGSYGLANRGGRTIELGRRMPVTGAGDILVSRGEGGTAVIRHRMGGATIGTIGRTDRGWVAKLEGGGELSPRTHQRASMMDLIGGYNKTAGSPFARPTGPPVQAPPVQTDLMQRYGVPAIRALATPTSGSSDGPRVTTSGSSSSSSDDDNSGPGGLKPNGVVIYKKLLAKGFPPARALTFARRAQDGPPGGKSS